MVSPNVGKALIDSVAGLLDALRILLKEEGYRAVGFSQEPATPVDPSKGPNLLPRPADPVPTGPVVEPTVGQGEQKSKNSTTKGSGY